MLSWQLALKQGQGRRLHVHLFRVHAAEGHVRALLSFEQHLGHLDRASEAAKPVHVEQIKVPAAEAALQAPCVCERECEKER